MNLAPSRNFIAAGVAAVETVIGRELTIAEWRRGFAEALRHDHALFDQGGIADLTRIVLRLGCGGRATFVEQYLRSRTMLRALRRRSARTQHRRSR
jgi:hypothetical protein